MEQKQVLSFEKPRKTGFLTDAQPIINLGKFLERPVQVFTTTWDAGGFATQTIRPWELFFDNPAVQNKLQNFAYINCGLQVEFKINSTPFNYGSMICAYHPMVNFSPNTNAVPIELERVCRSQRPHIWLSPEMNKGGSMELPFFYHKNYLQLLSRTDIQNMGEIDIQEFAQLRAANGIVSSPVTIQVFINAIDVTLTGGTVAGLLQSAKDEYGVEPISRPAANIAFTASQLTSVPYIGPFAKATEIGASALSQVAKIFGYTNPPVIDNAKPYKSLVFAGLSSGELSEPKDKFTLDPKAELTIDPATVGLCGEDEMAIPYIVRKESYLAAIDWTSVQNADDIIFNMAVTPGLREFGTMSNGIRICYTPMSHIAQLFNNWHGDIKVRFKFICSQYHRGRVRITWDPKGDIIANSDTMNTNFTQIVDLGIDRNVEFTIPYMQEKLWLETKSVRSIDHAKDWQTDTFTNLANDLTANGTLTMRVLTKLSAPDSGADIKVQMFIKGGDNLVFANPVTLNHRLSQFAIQSGLDEVENVDVGETNKLDENLFAINYGEPVISIRNLLRRSVLADIIPLESFAAGNNSSYVLLSHRMNKYPVPPGFNPDVFTRASTSIFTSESYAFTHMTPFNWMQSAYIGCRGSMAWKFNVNANGSSPIESIKLYRTLDILPTEVTTLVNATNGANLNEYSSYFLTNTDSCLSGAVVTNQRTQAGISAELSQFNSNRFVSSSNFNTTKGSTFDNSDRETYNLQLTFANQGRNDISGTLIERYSSIGTDFNFFFYLNAPITFYLDEDVTPN